MITVGIDLGTAAIKVVFIDKDNILWAKALPTLPQHSEVCEQLLKEGMETVSVRKEDIAGIATTGYGKHLVSGSKKKIDEISANAIGAYVLSERRARTIINIGGQDVKVIKVSSEGKVEDFKMNDKCAAGTGRFFEMAGRILDISVREFGDLSLQSLSQISLNSTCAVFAESEIVSLLSMGKSRNDIIAGLHKSVARRISELTDSLYLEEEIYLDGGPAENKGLNLAIKEELMRDINVFERPQFTVAFGAATIVSEK
ncbi:MAG: acyl-CoA dehydratase activase [Thermodesulfobacteriota bacterium]|nr:acyl-CoA dehydratase activase [Thermodesulfobacteriota bacterium]